MSDHQHIMLWLVAVLALFQVGDCSGHERRIDALEGKIRSCQCR